MLHEGTFIKRRVPFLRNRTEMTGTTTTTTNYATTTSTTNITAAAAIISTVIDKIK